MDNNLNYFFDSSLLRLTLELRYSSYIWINVFEMLSQTPHEEVLEIIIGFISQLGRNFDSLELLLL